MIYATGILRFGKGRGWPTIFRTVFRSRLTEVTPENAVEEIIRGIYHPALSWGDIAFLREHTSLPILLKGILHPEDAKLALEHGADGIVVSNHGGRQLDGAVSALEALPGIAEAVNGRLPVLLDSGVRTGSDVIKAMALGANAVMIGRPFMLGLAVAGEQGVASVLDTLLGELDVAMALSGSNTVADLNPSILVRV